MLNPVAQKDSRSSDERIRLGRRPQRHVMADPSRTLTRKPVGFTLIELLVVIAIIALLVSILLPSLNKAKDLAKTAVCMSNQRSLTVSTSIYTAEYEGYLPFATNDLSGSTSTDRTHDVWAQFIDESGGEDMRRCPATSNLGFVRASGGFVAHNRDDETQESDKWHPIATLGIVPNVNLCRRYDKWQPGATVVQKHNNVNTFRRHDRIMMVLDNNGQYAGGWWPGEHVRFRHDEGRSVLIGLLDGHVEKWSAEDVLDDYESGSDVGKQYNLFQESLTQYYPWGEDKED